MTGTSDAVAPDDDPDPVNRASARVQALVLRAAVTELTKMPQASSIAALFGMRLPTDATPRTSATWKSLIAASPVTHVSSDDPPTLLIHGDADTTVNYELSEALVGALQKVGVPSRLINIPGGRMGRGLSPHVVQAMVLGPRTGPTTSATR